MSSNFKIETNLPPQNLNSDLDNKNQNLQIQLCLNNGSQKEPSIKSQENQSVNQSDYSNLNNSDILSISKTDSSLSASSFQIMKNQQDNKDETSNLLISFSNISEADPRLTTSKNNTSTINNNNNVDNSNLSSSIVCKNKDNKDSSLTPSVCNYYLHSNNNTPCSHCSNDEVNIGSNIKIKQCNLNVIYNNLNNTNNNSSGITGSSKSKKTPIKYTKSQLNKTDDGDSGKKNLINLFNESNVSQIDFLSNLKIKEENFNINSKSNFTLKNGDNLKVENINHIEYVSNNTNHTTNNLKFEVRNCSNFSFDITKQIQTSNTNTINNESHSSNIDNSSKPIEYLSPKFNNGFQLTPSSNASQSTKEKSNQQKKITNHTKYISSFSLLPSKIIKSSSTNKLNKHKPSASLSKSKGKDKKYSKGITFNSKISNILGSHLNFLKIKPKSATKKPNNTSSKNSSLEKKSNSTNNSTKKTQSNTINFIHNIKPLAFLTGYNEDSKKIQFKDLIKIKPKFSPSPLTKKQKNRTSSQKEPKVFSTSRTVFTRINKVKNESPKNVYLNMTTQNNNNSLYSEYNTTKCVMNTNPNNISNLNNQCMNTTIKKPLKVIQNFSNYRKKSELNHKNNHLTNQNSKKNGNTNSVLRNKHIISTKLNKVGGDQESNFILDDY